MPDEEVNRIDIARIDAAQLGNVIESPAHWH